MCSQKAWGALDLLNIPVLIVRVKYIELVLYKVRFANKTRARHANAHDKQETWLIDNVNEADSSAIDEIINKFQYSSSIALIVY